MAVVKRVVISALLFNGLGHANAKESPIKKVVGLITSMKAEVEKSAEADLAAHDKFMCWCETGETELAESIESATAHDEELTSSIEEGSAVVNKLEEEIKSLKGDIVVDEDALGTATALREKEQDSFEKASEDTKGSIHLIDGAVKTVQSTDARLLQKSKGAATGEATALLQVGDEVSHNHPKFESIMQRDLFDLVGSIDSATSFRGSRKKVALLEEGDRMSESKGAAGAKTPAAGSDVVGVMTGLLDQQKEDLAQSVKEDAQDQEQFVKIKDTKTSEINVGTEQVDRKTEAIADTAAQEAKDKEDLQATEESKEMDETALANLKQSCTTEGADYKARTKTRGEEIVALAETLKILTEDDSRDLFGKSALGFMQLSSTASARAHARSQARAKTSAAQRVAMAARRHHSTQLAVLAVSVHLDAFKEAKEAMDKMMAQLQKQQKEEVTKKEFCVTEIDKTEDTIKENTNKKSDLDEKHLQLSNSLRTLETEIEQIKKEEVEMKVSLKQAGEQRKEENQIFQTSVADARATTNILQKAMGRMKEFYAFAQVRSHDQERESSEVFSGANPPPKPAAYQKSGGGGGVVALLREIIEDAKVEEQELNSAENSAQAAYVQFVKDTQASLEAHGNSLTKKTASKAEFDSARSETEQSQLATEQQLQKLDELLKAHNIECDWLLKYFDIRQQSRAEEMESITDAKAVLSGAAGEQ